jgi:hypothetical protein
MFKKAVLFSKIRNVVLCLITVIFCTAVFPPTHAATQTGTVTWTGYGGNYLWSTPDNWSTKKVPVTYQGIVVIPEGVTVQVDINTAPIQLQCEGNITVNDNAALSLTDGSFIKGKLVNNGTAYFNKGTHTFSGGAQGPGVYTLNTETKMVLDGGTYVFDGDIRDLYDGASVHVTGDSDVTINGYFKSRLSIGKDAKVTFNYDNQMGNTKMTRELSVENEGTLFFSNDVIFTNLNFISGIIESKGNITLHGNGSFKWQEGTFKGSGNFIVGRLRETKLQYKFYNILGYIFVVADEVQVPINDKDTDKPVEKLEIIGKGPKEMNLVFVNEAVVKISGGDVTFNNKLTNRGEFHIADGSGKVIVKKDFTQEGSGVLEFDIKSAKEYTRLQVDQSLQLNGAISCSFIDGYIPRQDASFTPLIYGKKPGSTFLYLYRNIDIPLSDQYDEKKMSITVSEESAEKDAKVIKEIQINKQVITEDDKMTVKLQQGFINDMLTAVDSKLDVNTAPNGKSTVQAGKDDAVIRISKKFDGLKTFCIEMPSNDLHNTSVQFTASELQSVKGREQIKVQTDYGSLTFPLNIVQNKKLKNEANVEVSLEKTDVTTLDKQIQALVGKHPVVDIALYVDGKPTKPNEKFFVSIPYEPIEEEAANTDFLNVRFIDESGNLVPIPSGKYDPSTKSVTFYAKQTGRFAVVYERKAFKDLAGVAWAKDAVEMMASKGIMKGTGTDAFSPSANCSRGDFIYSLVNALDLTESFTGNFDDVLRDAYYYQAIGIAKKLGIVKGTDENLFKPEENISRQDMMVFTVRALHILNRITTDADLSVLDSFKDKGQIKDYAKESIALLVKKGLMKGSDDKINPLGNTTRAEAAVFLHRIYTWLSTP